MSIEEIAAILKDLSAPLGTFVVLGNHDWWSDGDHIRNVLNEHDLRVLENESLFLKHNENTFWLIGIGDDFTHHAHPELAFSKVYGETPKLIFLWENCL